MSRLEIEALLAIEIGLWSEVAARIDSRLQRGSLKTSTVKRDNPCVPITAVTGSP